MAYLTLRTLFASFLALVVSAGQVCACSSAFAAPVDASISHAHATHHGDAHKSVSKDHSKHENNVPEDECGHCTQPPYVKASTTSVLTASLAAPSSIQTILAPNNVVPPPSNTNAVRSIKFFCLLDPPEQTPVSLKTRLLI